MGEWRGFLSDADREYIEKFNLNYLMYSGMVVMSWLSETSSFNETSRFRNSQLTWSEEKVSSEEKILVSQTLGLGDTRRFQLT